MRYWATSELAADLGTGAPSGSGWVAQCWTIEQFIADVKEVFGTNHDQIRSAQGILRFWHLAFLGYLSFEEQRATLLAAGADPGLTIGQTRCEQQKRHRRLLLDWIGSRYTEGLTSEQIDQLLAA